VSDKHITAHSGFMEVDLVLADRGFDIAEALLLWCCLTPSCVTKGKPQLSSQEVETTRQLSRV